MEFKFIDLFAGIGGFRLALESHGGVCVFSSEWDKNSQDTYQANFGERPQGDITKIQVNEIPSHDVICGGFPCQAFSISGKQKGFEDARGTLFYDVARIAEAHRPKVLFLENVKNLVRHDSGKTLRIILGTLDNLGYNTHWKVLVSSDYGVPQARERIYIVAFRKDLNSSSFRFPEPSGHVMVVKDILETGIDESQYEIKRDDITIIQREVENVRRPRQIGKINKGGQGERIYSIDAAGITLSAYGGGAASKTGAYLVGNQVRKLSPRECARMQGFPENYKVHPNKNLAYKQFGDSVSVPVLRDIFGQILEVLKKN
jgi:DNA (cytosine-5)-methyltransferase 1